jgi:hypothetical protein
MMAGLKDQDWVGSSAAATAPSDSDGSSRTGDSHAAVLTENLRADGHFDMAAT